jgi:hypothetical protein
MPNTVTSWAKSKTNYISGHGSASFVTRLYYVSNTASLLWSANMGNLWLQQVGLLGLSIRQRPNGNWLTGPDGIALHRL